MCSANKFQLLLLSVIVGGSRGHPSATGWQENIIPGSAGWQPTSGSGSSGKTEWRPAGSSSWPTGSGSPESTGWSSASGSSSGWPSGSGSGYNFYDSAVSTDYVSRYHGPIALPVVLPDGTLADTPEVAAARAAHLSALEKAKELWYGPQDDGSYDPHKYESHHDYETSHDKSPAWKHRDTSYHSLHTETNGPLNTPYSGPLATPKVLPSGYLEDTPSTAAARAAHLTALWKAKQEAEKWKQGWKP